MWILQQNSDSLAKADFSLVKHLIVLQRSITSFVFALLFRHLTMPQILLKHGWGALVHINASAAEQQGQSSHQLDQGKHRAGLWTLFQNMGHANCMQDWNSMNLRICQNSWQQPTFCGQPCLELESLDLAIPQPALLVLLAWMDSLVDSQVLHRATVHLAMHLAASQECHWCHWKCLCPSSWGLSHSRQSVKCRASLASHHVVYAVWHWDRCFEANQEHWHLPGSLCKAPEANHSEPPRLSWNLQGQWTSCRKHPGHERTLVRVSCGSCAFVSSPARITMHLQFDDCCTMVLPKC